VVHYFLTWKLGQRVYHIFFLSTSIQVSYESILYHWITDVADFYSFVNRFAIFVWVAESGNWHSTSCAFKSIFCDFIFFFWQLKQKGGLAFLIPIIFPVVYCWYAFVSDKLCEEEENVTWQMWQTVFEGKCEWYFLSLIGLQESLKKEKSKSIFLKYLNRMCFSAKFTERLPCKCQFLFLEQT
jgi:hypothetical protein